MRRIRYVPVEDVVPAEINAKRHAPAAIAASIDRFGFLAPLVVDGRTGRLVAGHGRLSDLTRRHAAGDEPPAGVRVKAGRWLVPVVEGWGSGSDDEANAAAVALNRIEEAGGWQLADLYALLDEIADGAGLAGTGFTADDLDTMLAELSREPVSYGGADSPARVDVGIAAKAETYRTNGVRSLVLDYDIVTAARLQEQMGRLRKARGAETNAVLVRQLLEEAE